MFQKIDKCLKPLVLQKYQIRTATNNLVIIDESILNILK